MNLFNRKSPQKLQVIQRLSSRVKLDEWRSSADLVNAARKVLNDPNTQNMLDVLRNEHPANTMTFDAPLDQRAVLQARSEGYTMALANLEALGVFQQQHEEMEATYEQPQEQVEP